MVGSMRAAVANVYNATTIFCNKAITISASSFAAGTRPKENLKHLQKKTVLRIGDEGRGAWQKSGLL